MAQPQARLLGRYGTESAARAGAGRRPTRAARAGRRRPALHRGRAGLRGPRGDGPDARRRAGPPDPGQHPACAGHDGRRPGAATLIAPELGWRRSAGGRAGGALHRVVREGAPHGRARPRRDHADPGHADRRRAATRWPTGWARLPSTSRRRCSSALKRERRQVRHRRRRPGRGRTGLVATRHRVGGRGRRPPAPRGRRHARAPPSRWPPCWRPATRRGVPVTAAAGRSGVCGGSIPVHGGIALDLTGLDGLDHRRRDVAHRRRAGRHVRPRPRSRAGPGRRGLHPRPLAPVDGPLDGGRLAGLPGGRAVLDRATGRSRTWSSGSRSCWPTAASCAPRARAPAPPPGPNLTQLFVGSEGTLGVITEARLRIHPLPPAQERRAFGFESFAAGLEACRQDHAPWRHAGRARLYDETESERNFEQRRHQRARSCSTRPTPTCSPAPWPSSTPSAAGGRRQAARRRARRALARAPQRRLGPGAAVARRHRGRHGRDLGRVGRAARPLRRGGRRALRAIDGTLAASAHQSHSYTDGACLYFTFAGRGPEGDDAWRERYYRQAWDAVTDATMAHGAAISHHHGIGLNRSPLPAPRARLGLRGAPRPQGDLRPRRHPQPGQARAGLAVRARAVVVSGAGGSVLVVDVGTSGVRAAIVRPDATVAHEHHVAVLPDTPAPGLVEFDAARDGRRRARGRAARAGRRRSGRRRRHRQPAGVGHRLGARQRAARSLRASAGRTCARWAPAWPCRPKASALAPNASATKVMAILDAVDPNAPGPSGASCASAPWTPGWPGRSRAAAAPAPTPST